MDALITVLSNILPGLLSQFNDGKMRAQANEKVDNVFTPQLLMHLKEQVSKVLSQEVRKKLDLVSDSFANAVEEKRNTMNQIIEQNKSASVERQAQAAELKKAAGQVESMMSSLA